MPDSIRLSADAEREFWRGVSETSRFFMGDADVQRALHKLVRTLEDLHVPYAIIGALALNEFGYRRTTVDVDVLLTPEGLTMFKAHAVGRGYVEKFEGSRGVRDVEHNIDIDIVLTGMYPGDGKPKAVRFPDPAVVSRRGTNVSLLPLPRLVELKLASGMSAPHRLKDLADIQELIRICQLPATFADELDASVRATYMDLWRAAQHRSDE